MMDQTRRPGTVATPAAARQNRRAPLWHIVLLNDDQHTYDYVVEMLGELFHYDPLTGYRMACEVDGVGWVIVETTVLERAEFKRDQIHEYGRDWRLAHSAGPMRAVLEPAMSEDRDR
jgi:ATP-dependent Clp protease adaptor protein ClpS